MDITLYLSSCFRPQLVEVLSSHSYPAQIQRRSPPNIAVQGYLQSYLTIGTSPYVGRSTASGDQRAPSESPYR
ncbi:hypothetical protein BABINDRAFT_143401 [Babjeviella inositovora NRRL Y-12698]|uniref:Uncharacterized protein n=1 Tax=Babjeviella inositovora NRRL Y-12698 TaxID=984486 RepID=A0A1E3QR00_9ASCO|nr:uncharacterized protein BABINDRAFT_143401 [Babjeviella inositovora NRRL Y-12698]ODQ79492.1 hypothetical protein BABINDRAFT_143401 [Babjeviella inositovora NRRL Y-12698]